MGKSPKKPKQTKKITRTVHLAESLGLYKGGLPPSIVEVIGTLQKAQFEAYIVGGSVRDSLLGLVPKDFDAVTDARPHEIKAIFGGRCRIIGRRFKLAHVYSGHEMIEVATFRAPPKDENYTNEEGMIIRDNVWGDIEQDFVRRDFSINALYYQPIKGEVIDFCDALQDIQNRTLRLLGDAAVRIEEDPVRLLRALRFKAKLDFEFHSDLAAQFHQNNWTLLEQVSTHRLYDETQKMFGGGYLSSLLPLLFEFGAMSSLMSFAPNEPTPLMMAVAKNTDRRLMEGKSVNPAFFYAAMLWENYLHQLAKYKKNGLPFYEAQLKAAQKTMTAQRLKTAIPKFAEQFIVDIWLLQPKLVNPRARDIAKLESMPKFRAAFDFLVLREKYDTHPLSEPTCNMGAWWQAYQDANAIEKTLLIEDFDKTGNKPKRRRERRSDQPDQETKTLELLQLKELSLRGDDAILSRPQPLFVVQNTDQGSKKFDKPKHREVQSPPIIVETVPVPVFEQMDFNDEYFEKLLANDEPYIPAHRYRKRRPSSVFSIKEQIQGLDLGNVVQSDEKIKDGNGESVGNGRSYRRKRSTPKASNKHTQMAGDRANKPSKTTQAGDQVGSKHSKNAANTAKPRRRRKPNAKSKADGV